MDLKTLLETPPWDWPEDAGDLLLTTLVDKRAKEADRLVAAELVGDSAVMNDELANALLAIVGNDAEPEELRAKAALSLGPALEEADLEGFEDSDDAPITEQTFHNIRDLLRKLYLDEGNSKELRRRILEAAVRAPQDWQTDAIRAAYSSGDKDWMLTAVFAMGWVRGFDEQILESLESTDPQIHYEAVNAAGVWELDAAWPHVAALVKDPSTPKPCCSPPSKRWATSGPMRRWKSSWIWPILATKRSPRRPTEAMAMAQAMSGKMRMKRMKTTKREWMMREWIN